VFVSGARRSRLVAVRTDAAIAVAAAVLIGLIVSYVSLLASGALSIQQSDFLAYYAAGKLLLHGSTQIYSLPAVSSAERLMLGRLRLKDGGLPYLYPPYFAIALSPLARLPYSSAFAAWLAVNCALLGITLRALQRLVSISGRAAVLFWVASASFLPVFLAATQGQVSILLLTALTMSLVALRAGHEGIAGAALALATVKPFYLPVFLLLLAIRGHYRALLSFAGGSAALLVAGAPAGGLNSVVAYGRQVQLASHWHALFGFAPQRNQSLSGAFTLSLPSGISSVAWLVTAILITGVFVRLAWRSRQLELSWALATVAALLISPHVFVHDLTILLLPVAIAPAGGAPRSLRALLVFGYVAVIAGQRLLFVAPIQLAVLAMVAFAIWLALSLNQVPHSRRRGRAITLVDRGTPMVGVGT